MVVITRPRPRPKPALLDRTLGTSRRRRQAAYLAIGTGLKLLKPTLIRLTIATAVTLALLCALTLVVVFRLT